MLFYIENRHFFYSPHNKNVATNISKTFHKLMDKHFPEEPQLTKYLTGTLSYIVHNVAAS